MDGSPNCCERCDRLLSEKTKLLRLAADLKEQLQEARKELRKLKPVPPTCKSCFKPMPKHPVQLMDYGAGIARLTHVWECEPCAFAADLNDHLDLEVIESTEADSH